jgi:hypothetical protein
MPKTGKSIIITKVHPSTQISGQGFLWNNPAGSYVGDVTYQINDIDSNLTEIDKVNYMMKNLFDYVTSAGNNKPTNKNLHNINKFFLADNTESVFEPKLYDSGTLVLLPSGSPTSSPSYSERSSSDRSSWSPASSWSSSDGSSSYRSSSSRSSRGGKKSKKTRKMRR